MLGLAELCKISNSRVLTARPGPRLPDYCNGFLYVLSPAEVGLRLAGAARALSTTAQPARNDEDSSRHICVLAECCL